MKQKTFWLSIILLFAAGISVIFMIFRDKDNSDLHKKSGGVNAFMSKAIYTQFDQTGQIHTQMQTKHMKHYAKGNVAFFLEPRILIYTTKRIPWHISSNFGKSENGTTTIHLWNHVVLHQPQLDNNPETTITTSKITVYPKRSFAKTNQKVTIQRPDSVLKGIGVTADFKTGIIKLLTHSRGIYAPTTKQP